MYVYARSVHFCLNHQQQTISMFTIAFVVSSLILFLLAGYCAWKRAKSFTKPRPIPHMYTKRRRKDSQNPEYYIQLINEGVEEIETLSKPKLYHKISELALSLPEDPIQQLAYNPFATIGFLQTQQTSCDTRLSNTLSTSSSIDSGGKHRSPKCNTVDFQSHQPSQQKCAKPQLTAV